MTRVTRSGKDSGRIALNDSNIFAFYILMVAGSGVWGYHRYGGWLGAIRGLVVVQVILFLVGCAFFVLSMAYVGMPN